MQLRFLLAALWLVNGLEKFGVAWPTWLLGGTGDVPGMLGMMAEETPLSPLAWVINHLMLPLGERLTIPAGVIEVLIGLAFFTGQQLRVAGALGLLLQVFFWMGFWRTDWPFQYPALILAHLMLMDVENRWANVRGWRHAFTAFLALMWTYEGWVTSWALLGPAVAVLAGFALRRFRWSAWVLSGGAILGLYQTWGAWQVEAWGGFVWAYYTIAILHLFTLRDEFGAS